MKLPSQIPPIVAHRFAKTRHQLALWQTRSRQAWQGHTARERALLSLAALLIFAAVLWLAILKPTLLSINYSQDRIPQLRRQAAELQSVILQSQALREHSRGRISPDSLDDALQQSLVRAGLTTQAQWHFADPDDIIAQNHYVIDLDGASATQVLDWLASLPEVLSLRVATLDLSRRKTDGRELPGQVDGRITLVAPATETP